MPDNPFSHRIIIAGSRNFEDYSFLKTKVDFLLQNLDKKHVQIISGTARGADKLGERYAKENNISLKLMPANWDRHGNAAGVVRNRDMAIAATHGAIFWDRRSKGTLNMISNAIKYKLNYRLYTYERDR